MCACSSGLGLCPTVHMVPHRAGHVTIWWEIEMQPIGFDLFDLVSVTRPACTKSHHCRSFFVLCFCMCTIYSAAFLDFLLFISALAKDFIWMFSLAQRQEAVLALISHVSPFKATLTVRSFFFSVHAEYPVEQWDNLSLLHNCCHWLLYVLYSRYDYITFFFFFLIFLKSVKTLRKSFLQILWTSIFTNKFNFCHTLSLTFGS